MSGISDGLQPPQLQQQAQQQQQQQQQLQQHQLQAPTPSATGPEDSSNTTPSTKQYALRGRPEGKQPLSAANGQTRQKRKPKDEAQGGHGQTEEALTQPKPKRPRDLTTDEVEFQTAEYVGLNAVHVEEEEAVMLPPSTKLDAYVKVRNHVLSRWRADVSRYLSPEEAGQSIRKNYLPLVQLAWTFLNNHGYINFGVAPGVLRDPLVTTGNPAGSTPRAAKQKPTVIVVGAGLAGAAAARQLVKAGYGVMVLEGRNRPGGRVWSMVLESQDGQHRCVADMGGAIVTGAHGNPLAVLASQLGLACHHIREECPMYLAEGGQAPQELDDKVHKQHNKLLDAAHELREVMPTEVADVCSVGAAIHMLWSEVPREPGQERLHERLMHWHFSNVEFANAARLHTLSLRGWDQDDPYEMLGPHVLLPGCNGQLVEALLQEVPICYNAVVTQVSYGGKGPVSVTTADNITYTADAVLLTVPLGVLKRGCITFDPPLPWVKQEAINRLGFGVLNKVVMLFPYAFWGDHLDLLAHVASDPQQTGMCFLFYAYGPHLAGKGAILAALVSGAPAQQLEVMSVEEARECVLRVLRTMHEPRGVTVPEPLQVACTRWASDPMAFGSYSSVAVGATGEDYDTMAEDVNGRLFFGGEATISKWPATMHGAFLSGMREAAKIRHMLEPSRKRKRLKSTISIEIKSEDEMSLESGSETSDSDVEFRHHGSSNGEASGWGIRTRRRAALSSEADVEQGGTRNGQRHLLRSKAKHMDMAPAAVQAVKDVASAGALLKRLFAEVEPDVECGCISGLQGPPTTEWAHHVLLQVEHKGLRAGGAKSPALYCLLTSQQLHVVRNAAGGDEGRVAALVGLLGVQLVGRTPVQQAQLLQVLHAIISARKLEHLLHASPPPHTPGHPGELLLGPSQPQQAIRDDEHAQQAPTSPVAAVTAAVAPSAAGMTGRLQPLQPLGRKLSGQGAGLAAARSMSRDRSDSHIGPPASRGGSATRQDSTQQQLLASQASTGSAGAHPPTSLPAVAGIAVAAKPRGTDPPSSLMRLATQMSGGASAGSAGGGAGNGSKQQVSRQQLHSVRSTGSSGAMQSTGCTAPPPPSLSQQQLNAGSTAHALGDRQHAGGTGYGAAGAVPLGRAAAMGGMPSVLAPAGPAQIPGAQAPPSSSDYRLLAPGAMAIGGGPPAAMSLEGAGGAAAAGEAAAGAAAAAAVRGSGAGPGKASTISQAAAAAAGFASRLKPGGGLK